MTEKEFKIKSCPDFEFRSRRISPIDLLALATTSISFEDFGKTKEFYSFALENVEVKLGDKWYPVKYAGREVYSPPELMENIVALNEICQWFLENIIVSAFPKSSE